MRHVNPLDGRGASRQHRPNVAVVQLLGGLGPVDALEHSAELIRRVALRFGACIHLLSAPGIVSNREAAQALRADRRIGEAKYPIIRAALRGGILDVLVTDQVTAQKLIDEG